MDLLKDLKVIIGKLLEKLLPLIFKQLMPELKPLQKYVYEKNDLDDKVEKMEKQIEALTMTCKAIDTKVDATFKMKKKFK